jgi:sugar lactone lactonase YvrE/enterochelin esterase-like enzyme
MEKTAKTPKITRAKIGWISSFILFTGLLPGQSAPAEDWGAYALIPASAPAMVLEAVGAGKEEGTIVSIGKPANASHQKWIITPKGDGYFSIKPEHDSALVLAIAKGGTNNGAQAVLEADKGAPWQLWSIRKNESGNYNLIPKHAPEKGLDDNGGKKEPGSRQDLWALSPKDQHLQWMIKPLAGSAIASAPTGVNGEPPPYTPPTIKPADIPRGEIKKMTFSDSKIFPGTTREITVFVPKQYDGSQPACVYVKTDGYNPKEKDLMETLMATKEIPVTIGVFVRPGDLKAPMPGTAPRRNRCLEYDGMGDSNARFFLEEVLPLVAKQFDLKLSDSGNDRCIAGGSSGGITAFNAAWERPEAFSRVYCGSGSFVAFRGGHEFPTMVRKYEAKPIRAYLTTGMHDMENAAGDWYLLDQEMDKALKFSGYDYIFRIINGGHVAGFYDYYQEGMAYLWKDWPKPVQAGPSSPRAQDILLPGEGWTLVQDGYKHARGATCNATGDVFFADVTDNKIYRIDGNGKSEEYVSDADQANGLTVGADGFLYAVSAGSGNIIRYDGVTGIVVQKNIHGRSILAMPGGGFYVTTDGRRSGEGSQVWFLKGQGRDVVDTGLKFATGLAYRPDQWLLAVADGHSKWAYSYEIDQGSGLLQNRERYFWLHQPDGEDDAGVEALCYAREGQLFAASRLGIQVCADDGPTQVILPLPDRSRATAVCLGGKDMDMLYAFSAHQIWRRKVKVHAMGAFTPWTKVTPTKL